MNTETKSCQSCKKEFVIEPDDFGFYEQMHVPPPTWCPQCRMMRRMAFFNEHSFYKKLEKRTGKEIFSMFPSDAPIEIYDRDFWWSDGWDQLEQGRDYDWSRPFFEQLRELMLATVWPARSFHRMVASDYSNNAADLKNCYLCFNADMSEDCAYGVGINAMKNCLDIYQCNHSEFCYDIMITQRCYQCFFVSDCTDCRNVWLSYNCEDCSDCFGCVNLRHKKYHIFNQPYSKEEYEAKIKEMNVGSYASLEGLKKRFNEFKLKFPRRYMQGFLNQNVIGEYVYQSKNAKYAYLGVDCEHVKYSQLMALGTKDVYDYTNWGNKAEQMYETLSCGENVQRIKFSDECWGGSHDIEYSMNCISSSNLFGCVNLRKKEYCIFNKQYTKDEYEALLPRIKAQMDEMPYRDNKGRGYKYGEFFPPEFSFFPVNESAIIDFMDFSKEKAEEYGLRWQEPNPKEYQVTMKAGDLPDNISQAPPDILGQVIACATCSRGYRLISSEVEFLKRFNIPLPRLCPNCRLRARIKQRNLPCWYKRNCAKCSAAIETSYASERPEIIYCESCYQQEVV